MERLQRDAVRAHVESSVESREGVEYSPNPMRQLKLRNAAILLVCAVIAGCNVDSSVTSTANPPSTEKIPVVDTYHGVQVVDDYRWLEDWSKLEVQQWTEAQNAYARNILDRLESREAIRERVTELRSDQAETYFALAWRNGILFALKRQPPKQQPLLIVMDSPDVAANSRVILDPATVDPSGSTTIDFYEPSWDGKLVAVSLSAGGSES